MRTEKAGAAYDSAKAGAITNRAEAEQAAGRQAGPSTKLAAAGIGNTNLDLWAAGHRLQNFYMLGSMGLACPIALGVALAQPERRRRGAGRRRARS